MQVLLAPQAQAEYLALPVTMKQRVQAVFTRLADWPNVSGAKALRGRLAGTHRIRTGDWRVLFQPEPDLVIVTRIVHRRDAYQE